MNIEQSVVTCLRKYATFRGRASRSEYWWFALFTLVVAIMAGRVSDTLALILDLLLFLPLLAAQVRRLHDVGFSGWWLFLPTVPAFIVAFELPQSESIETAFGWIGVAGTIYILWLMVSRGVAFENQYGKPGPELDYVEMKQ